MIVAFYTLINILQLILKFSYLPFTAENIKTKLHSRRETLCLSWWYDAILIFV